MRVQHGANEGQSEFWRHVPYVNSFPPLGPGPPLQNWLSHLQIFAGEQHGAVNGQSESILQPSKPSNCPVELPNRYTRMPTAVCLRELFWCKVKESILWMKSNKIWDHSYWDNVKFRRHYCPRWDIIGGVKFRRQHHCICQIYFYVYLWLLHWCMCWSMWYIR